MKIKQHGKNPNWELDVTCKFCKAVITLEKAEDMYAKPYPIEGTDDSRVDHYITYHFICPECRNENKVASRNIREDIKEKIEFKE